MIKMKVTKMAMAYFKVLSHLLEEMKTIKISL
jgi:hypothetical protein